MAQSIVDVLYRGRECVIIVRDSVMKHHAPVDASIEISLDRDVIVSGILALLQEKGYSPELIPRSSVFGCSQHVSLLCKLEGRDGIVALVNDYCNCTSSRDSF